MGPDELEEAEGCPPRAVTQAPAPQAEQWRPTRCHSEVLGTVSKMQCFETFSFLCAKLCAESKGWKC